MRLLTNALPGCLVVVLLPGFNADRMLITDFRCQVSGRQAVAVLWLGGLGDS